MEMFEMQLPVYLDHAATTPVLPAVLEAMIPYFTDFYGNPSALHQVGMAARDGVDTARETLAELLNASPDEIVFTSGGTESDNAAIFGVARASVERGRHLLTVKTEHHAVLEPFETLSREGFEVEYIPVDGTGRVSLADVASRLRSDTTLVSIMAANNEIGTVQPIAEIGALCRAHGIRLHTDAVQAFGRLPLNVREMKIDLLSLSAHKFYGPKGAGALYVRRGTPLQRFQEGGAQEKGRRGGTLNVPGIVGLSTAAHIAHSDMEMENTRLTTLRDDFMARLLDTIPGVHIMGSRNYRLPHNIHFCAEGVEGEPMLLALDARGICASAGSACSAGSTEPSHVLKALDVPRELGRGALRLTMGRATTPDSLDYTLAILSDVVRDLRALSRPVTASQTRVPAGASI
jgi:cysteine desulfurase